jgi:hypothetical protein
LVLLLVRVRRETSTPNEVAQLSKEFNAYIGKVVLVSPVATAVSKKANEGLRQTTDKGLGCFSKPRGRLLSSKLNT